MLPSSQFQACALDRQNLAQQPMQSTACAGLLASEPAPQELTAHSSQLQLTATAHSYKYIPQLTTDAHDKPQYGRHLSPLKYNCRLTFMPAHCASMSRLSNATSQSTHRCRIDLQYAPGTSCVTGVLVTNCRAPKGRPAMDRTVSQLLTRSSGKLYLGRVAASRQCRALLRQPSASKADTAHARYESVAHFGTAPGSRARQAQLATQPSKQSESQLHRFQPM